MKLISEIRNGLRSIEGATDAQAFPPDLDYEGDQEAMDAAQAVWPGLGETNYVYPLDPFDADDESEFFDPVFEIAADVEQSLPQLGGKAGHSIQQRVLVRGMDALGWYVSFHWTAVQWGIYIPVSGLVHLAIWAFRSLPIPFNAKVGLAYHAIVHHELFHFAADYAIAQAELATQEAWYLPARRAFKSGVPPYCVDEEQLANAYMLSVFRTAKPALRVRGKQDALRQYVKLQPEGYRDALQIRRGDVPGKLKTLAQRYGTHALRSARNDLLWVDALGFDWPQQFPIRPRIDCRYCPVHLIHDGQRLGLPAGGLSYFSRLSLITESDRFQSQLRQLAKPIQKAWERTKLKLGTAVTNGADFKRWELGGENVFSVRVNDNFRAHLLRHRDQDAWEAIAIGPHKKMGHG